MHLLLVLLFFSLNVFAQQENTAKNSDFKWNFEISSAVNGQPESVSLSKKISWRWVTNVDGVRVLQWSVLVDTPWDLSAEKPTTETPSVEVKAKGNKLLVTTAALKSTIQLASGRTVDFQWRANKPVVIDENCNKVLLALKPAADSAPFFIGTSCSIKNEEVTFNLSFPADVDLSNSSIFEKAGKGENFRQYDLKKITAAKSKIASFEFFQNDRRYQYTLNSLKSESQGEKNEVNSRFVVGAGMASLSLKTSSNTFTDSKPFLLFQLLPKNVLGNLNLGFTIETTIGSVKETNSLSYYQASGFAGYNFKLGGNFELHPRIYEVISGQDSGSGINYQVNQAGAGLWTKWSLTPQLFVTLEGISASAGSQVIKSHSLISTALFYYSWGLGAQIQEYTVVDVNQNNRKFSQTVLSIQKVF